MGRLTIDNWKDLLKVYQRISSGVSAVSIYDQRGHETGKAGCGAPHMSWMQHLAWMLDHMPDVETEPEKFHRWLGFAQALLWVTGAYDLDQLREQTRNIKNGRS